MLARYLDVLHSFQDLVEERVLPLTAIIEGEFDVFGGQRLAVVPAHAFADV